MMYDDKDSSGFCRCQLCHHPLGSSFKHLGPEPAALPATLRGWQPPGTCSAAKSDQTYLAELKEKSRGNLGFCKCSGFS